MRAKLKWLLVLIILYPLVGCVSLDILMLADEITATEARHLLDKIRVGMTPAEVEAIMGRPAEYQRDYACVSGCAAFKHYWAVRGHSVEVDFDRSGHATERSTGLAEDGPAFVVRRIFRWVFLWWLPDD